MTQNDFYFCFNGPRLSGKSTLANNVAKSFAGKGVRTRKDGFAMPIKQLISTILGENYDKIAKDDPVGLLRQWAFAGDYDVPPCTPREFLINLHEDYLKREYGPNFLARSLIHRHRAHYKPTVIVVDDLGRPEERAVLPKDRSYVIQVKREGTNYDGDNRQEIQTPNVIYWNNKPVHVAIADMDMYVDGAIALFENAIGRKLT